MKYSRTFSGQIPEAKRYARMYLSDRRWEGNAAKIVADACMTSIGLNYFKIVVPRVEKFPISSLSELARAKPNDKRLASLMNNKRCWTAAAKISKILIKSYPNKKDFAALKEWAAKADYRKWEKNVVGKIKGVGINTFQYLRMQAGIDTTMPDKVIKRCMGKYFGVKAEDELELISKCEQFAKRNRISQIELCYAIWLKESDIKHKTNTDIELAAQKGRNYLRRE